MGSIPSLFENSHNHRHDKHSDVMVSKMTSTMLPTKNFYYPFQHTLVEKLKM